jgi:hypothetical protein
MNVRRTLKAILVTAATAGAPFFCPCQAMSQDIGPADSQSGNSFGSYAPEDSSRNHPFGARWTSQHGTWRSIWTQHTYRPTQPNDWGCGPYGPRHNLNASQKSPSGMTWW